MVSKEILNVIEEIKRLDFSLYPISKIRDILTSVGSIGYIRIILHPGKFITRARLNEVDTHFSLKSQLTYKSANLVGKCQRASLPGQTMFYGSIIPEILMQGEIDDPRLPTFFEICAWARDKKTSGKVRLTFSRWDVSEELNLIALFNKEEFYKASSYIKYLIDDFNSFIDSFPDKKDDTMYFSSFLAEEFGKEVNNNHDYLVSAIFSNLCLKSGFDGVVYPSVQLKGKGINVAIAPDAADQKLRLTGVLECVAYKNEESIVLDNEYHVIQDSISDFFTLQPVEPEDKGGEEECLKILGVGSLSEILNSGNQ